MFQQDYANIYPCKPISTREMTLLQYSLYWLFPREYMTSKQLRIVEATSGCCFDVMYQLSILDVKNHLQAERKKIDACLPVYYFVNLTVLFVLFKKSIRVAVSIMDWKTSFKVLSTKCHFFAVHVINKAMCCFSSTQVLRSS